MNKKIKIYAIAWAILLVAFNLICFVTPKQLAGFDKFGGAFWIGYIFIMIAFIGQLGCACIALKSENKTKLFYNIPIIRISYTGLILTLIFGAAVMAIPDLPNWIGAIICLVILMFTAIAVIKAKAASDAVENIDKKVKAQTSFIKSLTVDAESLAASAKSPEAKDECKRAYVAIRYSDPMSDDALTDIESRITFKFSLLSAAVNADDIDTIRSAAREVIILINDRNKKCRALK